MKDTLISWCHNSLNFWSGCRYVSAECSGCYAKTITEKYGNKFNKVRQASIKTIAEAFKWNDHAKAHGKAYLVFTCSMSDFFIEDADAWREDAWDVIKQTPNLYWMILTKRPERIAQCLPSDWGNGYANVWLGTTCGSKKAYPIAGGITMTPYDRLDILRAIPCQTRFISAEPLLESLKDINLSGYHWIAAGGMSGELWKDKTMQLKWAAELYDRCRAENVAYLFKQVSAYQTERGVNALNLYLAERDGKTIDPATCELIRNHPQTAIPLMPFPVIGPDHHSRFSMKQWEAYKKGQLIDQSELVTIS